MSGHSPWKIALIVFTVFVYVVEVLLNALNNEAGRKLGLYLNSTSQVSDYYQLEITPIGFTFSIWGFIFTWQFIWMIYVFTTICRKVKDGRYIYQLPLLPPMFYAVFIINSLLVISWLFVWDRLQVIAAAIILALTAFTADVCIGISFYRLHQNMELLIKQQATKEMWFIRFFVQNGLALYAAWVSVAALLNFSMVLHYEASVDMTTSCVVALSILTVELIAWFILDNFVLDKYSRYTFSMYITIVWALIGAVTNNYDLDARFTISVFLLVLLIVIAFMLVIKVVILIWRHFRRPLSPSAYEPTV